MTGELKTRSRAGIAFRAFVHDIIRISGRRAFITVLLTFLSSIAEGIGIAMFLPALQLAGFDLAAGGRLQESIRWILHFIARLGFTAPVPLATVLALVAFVLILRTLFLGLQYVYLMETVYRVAMSVETRLYESVLRARWTEIVRHRFGDFLNLLTTERERLVIGAHDFFFSLSEFLSASLYLALALLLSIRLTCVFGLAGIALALLLHRKTARVHEAATLASLEAQRLDGEAVEHLQNLKAVKTYGAQDRDLAMFSALLTKSSDLLLVTQRREAAARFSFEGGSFLIIIVILYFALTVRGTAAGNVFLLLAVFARVVPKLTSLYATLQSVVANLPAHTRMEAAIQELAAAQEAVARPTSALHLADAISFREVTFRFSPGKGPILNAISLTIPARKITAITGPSGAGKSTLADLLIGLLPPESGQIFIDGTELTPSTAPAWRLDIGYVAQDTVLFHDSVRANLLWAKPDATEQEMRDALSLVAADFVLDAPAGLDTVVGDRGVLLSNGERQRIAIARALLRRPALLVLDEATNNLDVENERRVLEAILRLRGDVTVLLIAHRLSTLQYADLIYLLEAGKIVQSGDYKSVVEDVHGRFHELFNVRAPSSRRGAPSD